jgi:hypothetical protein
LIDERCADVVERGLGVSAMRGRSRARIPLRLLDGLEPQPVEHAEQRRGCAEDRERFRVPQRN